MSAERITGTVKWFSNIKGYGFITPDPAAVAESSVALPEDIFVHQSVIHSDGYRTLGNGWQVEFRIGRDEHGKVKAEDVTAVGGGPCTGPIKSRRFRPRNGKASREDAGAKKEGQPRTSWHDCLQDSVKSFLDERGVSRKDGTLLIAFGGARIKLGINSYASLVHEDKIIAEGSFSCDEDGQGTITFDWKKSIQLDTDDQTWKTMEDIAKLVSELSLVSNEVQAVEKGENMASLMGGEVPDPKSVLESEGFQMRRFVFSTSRRRGA